jgi:hypothetical protein
MPSVTKALGYNDMFYGDFAVAGETRLGVDLDNARYDIGTLDRLLWLKHLGTWLPRENGVSNGISTFSLCPIPPNLSLVASDLKLPAAKEL